MIDAVLALKVIPPRPRRDVIERPRLDNYMARAPVTVIEAPAGYGKTLLLAQWRCRLTDEGLGVGWLTLDDRDDERRVLEGLALALRSGAGRDDLGVGLENLRSRTEGGLKGAANLLSEWAKLPQPPALILDDLDRLRDPQAAALARYIIANAPRNARLLAGTRSLRSLSWVRDLAADRELTLVGRGELAFTLEESLAFLRRRLSDAVTDDLAARIYETTGGWAIGLELSASKLAQSGDPAHVVDGTQYEPGAVAGALIAWATATWPPEMKAFLVEISILTHLNEDLCVAVTGYAEAPRYLSELRRRSALILEGEDDRWFRLHHLALEHLREEARQLPLERRKALHRSAAEWLMRHGFWADATQHALEAGATALAFDCMEQSLRRVVSAGKFDIADHWLELLPAEEITRRRRLRLAVAIRLAIRGSPDFEPLIVDLESAPEPEHRFTAAVVRALSASHADDPDTALAVLAPWADGPCSDDPAIVRGYHNLSRWLESLRGDPGSSRHRQDLAGFDKLPLGMSVSLHREAAARLRAADPAGAASLLAPPLEVFETSLGRRSPPALLIALSLAGVAREQDDFEHVRLLLADRLDLIDPNVLPDGLAVGLTTAAALAHHDGETERAFELLAFLDQRAQSRSLPRLRAMAAAEMIRLHVATGDLASAERPLARLRRFADDAGASGSLNAGPIRLLRAFSEARLLLAAGAPGAATAAGVAVKQAKASANRLLKMEGRLMHAAATVAGGGSPPLGLDALIREAESRKLRRMLRELRPALTPWFPSASGAESAGVRVPSEGAADSAMLTPREAEVLRLLSRGLSNKEIARALEIGEGTIKWHLKNLFAKFDAPGRSDLVARAALLGLVQT